MRKTETTTGKPRKNSIPKGYVRINVFLKPEFEKAISEMAHLHGLKKYYIINSFMEIFWNRFETGMNERIEKALEMMKEDLKKQ